MTNLEAELRVILKDKHNAETSRITSVIKGDASRVREALNAELQALFDEVLEQLGNAQWGQGNFDHQKGTWTVTGPSQKPNSREIFRFARGFNEDGSYLYVDHPFSAVSEKVLCHKNIDFVSRWRGINSYEGLIIVKPPFDREVISALVKAAVVLGPRTVDVTTTPKYPERHYVGEGNH